MELKKAQFFSIDALIALSIVIILLLVAHQTINYQKPDNKLQYDILSSFSNIKINEVSNPVVQSFIADGIINSTDKPVLDVIGELYVTNRSAAKQLAQALIESIPANKNIGIWYGNRLLASKNVTSYESSQNRDVARQVITGILEGNATTGYSGRAFLSTASQTKYYFFGGYVGDGNITALINYSGTLQDASIELAINANFSVYVNGHLTGNYTSSESEFAPIKYNIPTTNFISGRNNISFAPKNNTEKLRISGGFIKIVYNTSDIYYLDSKRNLPGVKGIINVYDGFYIPTTLNSLNAYLHFNSTEPLNFTVGNATIYSFAGSNSIQTVTLNSTDFSSKVNYNDLSNKTIPFRIFNEGFGNLSYGNADVVLITDVSGSMDWWMSNDNGNGEERGCGDPLLNSGNTQRLSVAKCIDRDFVQKILAVEGNNLSLVSFSTDSNSYVGLTKNKTLLNNTITAYSPTDWTCVSCAINRAYQILNQANPLNRTRYIVVMTDGVTNIRSTSMCMNTNAISGFDITTIQVGDSGFTIKGTPWELFNSSISSNLNDVALSDNNFGFAVGDSGRILIWSGTNWSSFQTISGIDLDGVSLLDNNLGFAVGENKIYKWNGINWTLNQTIGSITLTDVDIFNTTLGFATATNSNIYKWNGINWTLNYGAGGSLSAVKIFSSNLGFAVGASGRIYKWNGISWTLDQDIGSQPLTDVDILDSSTAFLTTGTNKSIYKWSGSSWTAVYSGRYNLNSVFIINSTAAIAAGDSREGLIYFGGSSWSRTIPYYFYAGNSTTGRNCADPDDSTLTTSIPALNANYSACRANQDLNATVFSIGFGPISTNMFGNNTINAIAQCGKGTSYSSSDPVKLQEIYDEIAQKIIKVSYQEQISKSLAGVTTELYSDSYIEFNFDKPVSPYGLVLSSEKQFTNTTSGSFDIPQESTIMEVSVISYSGPRWTSLVNSNNAVIYNLSIYGKVYSILGDPYSVNIPVSSLNVTGKNDISLLTGLGPGNLSEGSINNKIIYTIIKNITSYNTSIVALSSGCDWNLTFEDGTSKVLTIPPSYSGTEACEYSNSSIYDSNDALQQSAFELLSLLDFENPKNGRINVNLVQDSLQAEAFAVSGVPFAYTTEVQVRTWS